MNDNVGYTPVGNFNNVTINGFNSEWANSYHFTNSPITYKTIDLKNVEIESIDFSNSFGTINTNQNSNTESETVDSEISIKDLVDSYIPNFVNSIAAGGIAAWLGLGQGFEQVADCAIQTTVEVLWVGMEVGEYFFEGIKWFSELIGDKSGTESLNNLIIDVNNSQESMIAWTANIVGTNWTKQSTDFWIDYYGIRTSATDDIVDWVRKIEDAAGNAMLAKLPGPWAGIATAIVSEGKSAEEAYAAGADFGEVVTVSHIAGVIGFLKGFFLKMISSEVKVTDGSGDFLDILRENLKKIGISGFGKAIGFSSLVSLGTDFSKWFANYYTYAKDLKNEDGELKYDDFIDYFLKEKIGTTIVNVFFSGLIGPLTAATGVDSKFDGFWQTFFKDFGVDAFKEWFKDLF